MASTSNTIKIMGWRATWRQYFSNLCISYHKLDLGRHCCTNYEGHVQITVKDTLLRYVLEHGL
jgi:hypothetical protein